ncbi:MAG: tetraacyldisaccharide 4'-kinase, partial [Xanthomonadales bacterium]|nr:tetraacyldisaccharide 4'-kinase [Xanthomonadales bacterium]
MSLAEDIQKYWYVPGRPPWVLRALAGLYAAVSGWRRRAYQLGWLRSQRLPVPVIVVGNISVGGTGKTTLVIA